MPDGPKCGSFQVFAVLSPGTNGSAIATASVSGLRAVKGRTDSPFRGRFYQGTVLLQPVVLLFVEVGWLLLAASEAKVDFFGGRTTIFRIQYDFHVCAVLATNAIMAATRSFVQSACGREEKSRLFATRKSTATRRDLQIATTSRPGTRFKQRFLGLLLRHAPAERL